MSKYKEIFLIVFILVIQLASVSISAGERQDKLYLEYDGQIYRYNERVVDIQIDGNIVETGDMPAVILDNRTLVPLREVFESDAIGAEVMWKGDTKEIYIVYLDQFIVMKIDSKVARVNGEEVELDVPAKLIRDTSKTYAKTMIPLRFVAEHFGYTVEWNGDAFIADLYSEGYEVVDETTASVEDNSETDMPVGDSTEDNNETDMPIDDSDVPTDETDEPDDETDYPDDETNNRVEVPAGVLHLDGTGSSVDLPTGLADDEVKMTAGEDGLAALRTNAIYSTVTASDEDESEIYNVRFFYDDNTPQNVLFEISANDPLSDVQVKLVDDLLVVEVMNTTLDMNTKAFEYDDHPFITSLKLKQLEDEATGDQKVRMVFDLKTTGYTFHFHMNELREKVYMEAIGNNMTGIEIGQNATGDYIDILGVGTNQIKGVRSAATGSMTFEVAYTRSRVRGVANDIDGQYIRSVDVIDDLPTKTIIDVKTEGQPEFDIVVLSDDRTRIQLKDPEFKNIAYTNDLQPVIAIDGSIGLYEYFDLITNEDNYHTCEFVMIFPGDRTEFFGDTPVHVGDDVVERIEVKLDENGDTRLSVYSSRVQAYDVKNSREGIRLMAYDPSDLYEHIIVIDPGHGGGKNGASISGYREKDINLSVTMKLKELLDREPGVKVYYTRLDDSDISLKDRADLANDVNADFFLSIHANSYWALRTGAVTLYTDKGFKDRPDSYDLAKIIHEDYVSGTEFVDKVITERDDIYVLKYTKMPSVLLELGFMSNPSDLTLLVDQAHQVRMAAAILDGISRALDEGF